MLLDFSAGGSSGDPCDDALAEWHPSGYSIEVRLAIRTALDVGDPWMSSELWMLEEQRDSGYGVQMRTWRAADHLVAPPRSRVIQDDSFATIECNDHA